MSGSGRESHPEVWEALQMSWSGQETLPDVPEGWVAFSVIREWSTDPLGCPGVVGWPSRILRSGREALLDVWQL